MIPFSVLDLAPILAGSAAAQACRDSVALAQCAEHWGYQRYWLAEHHNMPGIASAATAVVIGHIAGVTSRIRVGAGGVMLPNHSPLVIAEHFGTLESLYPGRIDLGLGRAVGSDMLTARAMRRDAPASADRFPQDVQELQALLGPIQPDQRVRAVPGTNLRVPLWILGSSLFGAQLAAALGLPFAFASHFAPEVLLEALDVYRTNFQPSSQLERPYTMVGVNLFAAATDAEATRLFTSLQQQFTNLFRGAPGQLQPPLDDIDTYWSPTEKTGVDRALIYAMVGSKEVVQERLKDFIEMTAPDEVMITAQIYDHAARLRSFEIAAKLRDELMETHVPKSEFGHP
ncbi:MAG: LLM class flavin-dependent oxidoreductase [Proteobacteria bacterium]|nr:LLM class flavin-dependent oxidoreductase [Pseudomonadota bacterium]